MTHQSENSDMHISTLRAGFVASLLIAAPFPALAETMKMMAMLDGGQQVPPVTTEGTGMADLTYDTDTRKLSWTVEYSGLSGPPAAAHIHGPAAKGANAGVAIPFKDPASPITGEATLTDEQAKALMDGMMYVIIHTAAHKDGEIRGQIEKDAM